MHWTNSDVEKAVGVLGRCGSVGEAAGKIGTTEPALRAAFQRARERGLNCGSPGDHVGGARGDKAGSASNGDGAGPAGAREIEKVFFIPDVHVPNHHKQAWNVCLNAIRAWRPHRVVILGDFADDECVSSHSKGPDRNRLLKNEIVAVRRELDRLQDACRDAGVGRVDYIEGNHCDRLSRYLQDRAPELYGLVSMPELMRIAERGWHWTPYKSSLRVGKLVVTHDFGFAGANAATQNLMACGHSCITGHTHRASVVYQGHTDGQRHVSITSGWLGDAKEAAKYKHLDRGLREWQHGIVTAEMTADGLAWCNFHPIIKGKMVLHGQVVRG